MMTTPNAATMSFETATLSWVEAASCETEILRMIRELEQREGETQ